LKGNGPFAGTCHFHLQGERTSEARNQLEASSKQHGSPARHFRHAGFLLGLFFGSEDRGDMFIRNFG
jgi:hypothetical protein